MRKCYACWGEATKKKMRNFPSTGMIREVYQCDNCSMHSDREFENCYKLNKQKRAKKGVKE